MEFLEHTTIHIFITLNILTIFYILLSKFFFHLKETILNNSYKSADELLQIIIDTNPIKTMKDKYKQQDIVDLAIYLDNIYLERLKSIYRIQKYNKVDWKDINSKRKILKIEALRRITILQDETYTKHLKAMLLDSEHPEVQQEIISYLLSVKFEEKYSFVKNNLSTRNVSKHNEILLNRYFDKIFHKEKKDKILAKKGIHQVLIARLKKHQHRKVQDLLRNFECLKYDLPMEVAFNIYYFGNLECKKIICNIILDSPEEYKEIKDLYSESTELHNYLSFHKGLKNG